MEEPANVAALESQIGDLMADADRYRTAAEEALGQVDWCIGWFTAKGQTAIARSLNANRSYIRSRLMHRAEQPLPTAATESADLQERIPRQSDGTEGMPE